MSRTAASTSNVQGAIIWTNSLRKQMPSDDDDWKVNNFFKVTIIWLQKLVVLSIDLIMDFGSIMKALQQCFSTYYDHGTLTRLISI